MKYKLTPGMRIGKLTLVRRLPKNPDDYAYRWVCKCDCGTLVEKSRVVLTDKKVQHRCSECYSRSAKAYGRLMYISANPKAPEPDFCALGSCCRCHPGDQVGCWNWIKGVISCEQTAQTAIPDT